MPWCPSHRLVIAHLIVPQRLTKVDPVAAIFAPGRARKRENTDSMTRILKLLAKPIDAATSQPRKNPATRGMP
jgi:hypothetical protein